MFAAQPLAIQLVAAMMGTILIASVSYYFVDNPFLSSKSFGAIYANLLPQHEFSTQVYDPSTDLIRHWDCHNSVLIPVRGEFAGY
jgi:hypothetical protein